MSTPARCSGASAELVSEFPELLTFRNFWSTGGACTLLIVMSTFPLAYRRFVENPGDLDLRDIHALKERDPQLAVAAAEACRAALERQCKRALAGPRPVVKMARRLPVVRLQRAHAIRVVRVAIRTPPNHGH